MEDVGSKKKYQETGQEKRPARMVGLHSLDFTSLGRDAEYSIHLTLNDGGGIYD